MVVSPVDKWWDRFGDTTKKDKINEIINKMIQRDPDYDSGWFAVGTYAGVTKTHSLGTDHCLVQAYAKDSGSAGINIQHIGKMFQVTSQGGWWSKLTSTTIYCWRTGADTTWDQFRLLIWELE